MAIPDRQHYALQTIFSFFLGLMALASIGVGVNTFYPAPDEKFNLKMRELNRRQESIRRMEAPGSFGPIERARLDSLAVAQDALSDQEQSEMKDWARVTSIVLVLFATLVLVISLGLNERLRVISNGLLLGGLFTMIYGVGWVIFSGNSVARFCVIVFALAVSVGLGYAKFVRGKRQPAAAAETLPTSARTDAAAALTAALERRIEALEERVVAAAAALAGRESERPSRAEDHPADDSWG